MPEWGTALIIVAAVIVVFLLMGYIKAPPIRRTSSRGWESGVF